MILSRLVATPATKQARPELFIIQKRHSFYNKYRHGPQAISNPEPPYKEWLKELLTKKGWQFVWSELKSSITESLKWKYFVDPPYNKVVKFEEFDSDESIKAWKPVADRDSLNGYSQSRITRSPAGHGLFSGILDNQCPDDGMTENSGFAAVIGPRNPKIFYPFQKMTYWDWRRYNCVEIRFRGDGRKYQLVISTGTYSSDLEYYDCYSYFLHTRGGPYWQTMQIPFHKFVFNYKNYIQDRQFGPQVGRIKFIAINLQDKIDGPFALEIDYIGLVNQTTSQDIRSAYEGYTFEHIIYRPVQVDSPAPEV